MLVLRTPPAARARSLRRWAAGAAIAATWLADVPRAPDRPFDRASDRATDPRLELVFGLTPDRATALRSDRALELPFDRTPHRAATLSSDRAVELSLDRVPDIVFDRTPDPMPDGVPGLTFDRALGADRPCAPCGSADDASPALAPIALPAGASAGTSRRSPLRHVIGL